MVADRGREAIDLGRPVLERVIESWRAHLGDTKFDDLRRSLEALREITDLDRSKVR